MQHKYDLGLGIGVYAIVDGQLQRYGILTALCIIKDVIIVARSTIALPISVPDKALTGHNPGIGVYAIVDGQLQHL